jgi:hypothetical protein
LCLLDRHIYHFSNSAEVEFSLVSTQLCSTQFQIQPVCHVGGPRAPNCGCERHRTRGRVGRLPWRVHDAALVALTAAEERASAADAKVHELESNLAGFAPARQVQLFLKERSTSQAYASQLGLVSLIRRDFERLSELLQQREDRIEREREAELERRARAASAVGKGRPESPAATAPASNPPTTEPAPSVALPAAIAASTMAAAADQAEVPIDRIVLYIDDLDRCKPRRVIEVLEAVHLLLAFRLFVVIVAVDPRWLRRCLEDQYPELLSMAGRDGGGSTGEGLTRTSTPQDYLEKIFQIPFYLRPLRDQGFVDLVGDLVGKDIVEDQPEVGDAGRDQAAAVGVSSTPTDPQPKPADGSSSETRGGPFVDAIPGYEADAEPQRLLFNAWEVEDMQRLSPLFRTPRSAKRFVNTYRLIRATVEAADRPEFEGTREAPGSYRLVLLLLSVVAGYPNVAPRLLLRLAATAKQPTLTWAGFVKQCRATLTSSGPEVEFGDSSEWRDLCDGLDRVSRTDLAPRQVAALYPWIPRVARYSFSVSLPGALDDLLESMGGAAERAKPRGRLRHDQSSTHAT